VLAGLLAVALVGVTVAASTLFAFGGQNATAIAQVSPTTLPTKLPATTAAPSATRVPPTASATARPPTRTAPPSLTPSPPSSATLPASPTATGTAPPTETPTPVPSPTAPATLAAPTIAPTTCIPAPPAGWVVYVIQRGDTLFNLALRFGVSQASLQRVNCIANASDIRAGDRIFAPRVDVDTQPPPASSTPAASPTIPSDIPTITSMPVPTATPNCVPPEFFDPLLNRCRLPDP
jgi:LysM repeat protein